jgi:malto-oligosyltrehalose synthase/4-alpha-glucanotransferase
MFDPVTTYRIQFHKDFTFSAFEKVIPYLQQLGIKTIYASPIFDAVPSSTHGYDIVDPLRINPEIGTLDQLRDISRRLKAVGIGWLQDIVPNHMAFHPRNTWLMNLLEKGRASEYAGYFDIDWEHPSFSGKLMVPFLDSSLGNVIHEKRLQLTFEQQKLYLNFSGNLFPVQRATYKFIADQTGDPETNISAVALEKINSDISLLQTIAGQQHYILCHWRDTEKQINYRRFFTINGLIGLRMEDEALFNHYHKFIKQLIEEGIVQGLRVDHIDGLYDPTEYLYSLRSLAGENAYIIVEKILQADEQPPRYWPIQGTTGYDFLGTVNNLFTYAGNQKKFTAFYKKWTNNNRGPHPQLLAKKADILYGHMAGELDNLYRLFNELNLVDADVHISSENIKAAIGAFLVHCPVYKFYGNQFPLEKHEATEIRKVFASVKKHSRDMEAPADILIDALLVKPIDDDKEYNTNVLKFYKRCMQYTGPLMAKGVEDTFMYNYNRLIAHNDVGDTPTAFGIGKKEFHEKMIDRKLHWPLTMNATSTHDTKRGEDARARLNVLSEAGNEWLKAVTHWKEQNSAFKKNNIPDANDELFIYQSLIACHPMPGETDDSFPRRFKAYIQKALREAKVNTNWAEPNDEYESAVALFIDYLLDKNTEFYNSFYSFLQDIADAGIINSLSQLIIKQTCPGVPDTYQGSEMWNLSMVDPDNRAAVNFDIRRQLLQELEATTSQDRLIDKLWNTRYSAKIKLWLAQRLCAERSANADFFLHANYIPLEVHGKYKNHVMAFARQYRQTWYVIAVPLHIYMLCKEQQQGIPDLDWNDTWIKLPPYMPGNCYNVLSKEKSKSEYKIDVHDIFKTSPFAILRFEAIPNKRGAGILLPVFSLPAKFGIGDCGPAAYRFADFLFHSNQKYWQVLPLSPVDEKDAWSPYSSISGMAGNALFISPELLAEDGLLTTMEIERFESAGDRVDYESVVKNKDELFSTAYRRFKARTSLTLQKDFEIFCETERRWLDNFALFVVIKNHFNGQAWSEWPNEYKNKENSALQQFEYEYSEDVEKTKWLQYIFARQWQKLKRYCNNLGVKLIGDLPFYVSYDSVAVWQHPELFCLDQDRNMTGISGVPPDYFSETGQLWNMPTYNWARMKADNYNWWINRLQKNLQQFDLLRIDHYRAFEAYWEVATDEETAQTGRWIKGPGMDFFNTVKGRLGTLPFIAEDLGNNMEDVYVLREKTGLPGMKVLQYAWGENIPMSVDIPHNYPLHCIVYTGTHDNNTTTGWYKDETKNEDRKRMKKYLGLEVTQKNVHKVLARLAYASVAQTAILPLQDVLGLDENERINTPGTGKDNWRWRLKEDLLSHKTEKQLREWAKLYNRL